MGEDLEQLKQRLPLLDYLRHQNWIGRPAGQGPEFVGLCPLHPETRPSFYVNARKNLFYCHGCGQGGDLIRFVELSQHLVDANGSGQQAAHALAHRLRAQGITPRRVLLPSGHDPNSFFVQGGDARQFHSLLEAAQP
jgi:DNA primase